MKFEEWWGKRRSAAYRQHRKYTIQDSFKLTNKLAEAAWQACLDECRPYMRHKDGCLALGYDEYVQENHADGVNRKVFFGRTIGECTCGLDEILEGK